jgi:hypothetical protein
MKKRSEIAVFTAVQNNMGSLTVIALISLVGFLLAVAVYYVRAFYLVHPYPFNTFLFNPADKFSDFYNVYKILQHLNPYLETGGQFANYFPFTYIFLYLFRFFESAIVFNVFLAGFIIPTVAFLYLSFSRYELKSCRIDWQSFYPILAILVSYPVLFTVDRGNVELYVFVFLALYFLADRYQKSFIAGVSLAMAIAMKLYPAILLVYLLARRKYRQLVVVCLATMVMTVGSLLTFKGGIAANLDGLNDGLKWYNTVYVEHYNKMEGIVYNQSFLSVIRYQVSNHGLNVDAKQPLKMYLYGVLILFGVVSLYTIYVEKQIWRQVTLMILCMILLPYVSADYKLIHLVLPITLYVQRPQKNKFDILYAIIFGLLLVPKNAFASEDLNFNTLSNNGLMLLMLILITGEGVWLAVSNLRHKHQRSLTNGQAIAREKPVGEMASS